eukprot:420141-Prymnesium_polylepis.2
MLRIGAGSENDTSLAVGADGKRVKRALRRKSPGGVPKSNMVQGTIELDSDLTIQQQLRQMLSKYAMKMLDLFRQWDEDGSGQISRKEFRQAVASFGIEGISKEDINGLFDSFDADGSGTIDYNELAKGLRRGGTSGKDLKEKKSKPKRELPEVGGGAVAAAAAAVPPRSRARTLAARPHVAGGGDGGPPRVRTEAFIARGVDVDERDEFDGRSVLFYAASAGQTAVSRLLVAAGADFDATDKRGWTPLMTAANNGHARVVRVLLDAGCDIHAKDGKGNTALRYAEIQQLAVGYIGEQVGYQVGKSLRRQILQKGYADTVAMLQSDLGAKRAAVIRLRKEATREARALKQT